MTSPTAPTSTIMSPSAGDMSLMEDKMVVSWSSPKAQIDYIGSSSGDASLQPVTFHMRVVLTETQLIMLNGSTLHASMPLSLCYLQPPGLDSASITLAYQNSLVTLECTKPGRMALWRSFLQDRATGRPDLVARRKSPPSVMARDAVKESNCVSCGALDSNSRHCSSW